MIQVDVLNLRGERGGFCRVTCGGERAKGFFYI